MLDTTAETRPDCRALADLLAERAEALFETLIPDARIARNEERGHGPDGAIWSMVLRGRKRGIFCNFSDPERQAGDCLELIHHALFPGEKGRSESYRWALRFLGLDSGDDAERAQRLAAARQRAAASQRLRAEQAEAERQKRQTKAKGIYLYHTQPYDLAPQIADYLTHGRGLPVADLPGRPVNLRFGHRWYDQQHQAEPAIVAAIVHPITRQHRATHVTYLQETDGHFHNTSLRPKRLCFGNKQGGVIPLLRGASKQRQPPPGETLILAEGIENALAAALLAPETPDLPPEPRVWAGIDIGNLGAIELPEAIATVALVHDNDNERFGAWRERIAKEWQAEGRRVIHMRPPRGFKDMNEYVERLARERR